MSSSILQLSLRHIGVSELLSYYFLCFLFVEGAMSSATTSLQSSGTCSRRHSDLSEQPSSAPFSMLARFTCCDIQSASAECRQTSKNAPVASIAQRQRACRRVLSKSKTPSHPSLYNNNSVDCRELQEAVNSKNLPRPGRTSPVSAVLLATA